MKSAIAMFGVSLVCAACTTFPPAEELPVVKELPDPLVLRNGHRVASVATWEQQRRPELQELFTHYMYGRMPPRPGGVSVTVERVAKLFDGAATKSEITLAFRAPESPPIHLLLVTPSSGKPAPVFVALNFHGNQAVLADPSVALTTRWINKAPGVVSNAMTEAGRGVEAADWNVEALVKRGYALATFHTADIEPDRPQAAEGTRAAYPQYDWGNIAAWAWGMHRVVDHLASLPNIDAKRIAAFGWSRNGKAALLAAATDERIALVIPHQAGCGGSGPSRHNDPKAETIKRINTAFPHWFNAEFKQFVDEPARLPFDQHELVALCAPRAVLFSVGAEDLWSNPAGQFAVLKAAEPVYALYGAGRLPLDAFPASPGLYRGGPFGFYLRPGKHSLTAADWQHFMDFADACLGAPVP